ncbi:hypothetical protein C8P64_2526 [Christiangramia gaetbulicola]|uniref:Membrane or secreted protein n=2 Tax=Christiangramia gaetbulicola TaxID=703340 RepID=A0A2T6AE72_9FLAO|nr:hypothetical protein C8P64_2526 [Christiangramia gaetbulicola]
MTRPIFSCFFLLLFLHQNLKDMKLLIISIILLGLAFAGIAIKIWGKKDGKFAGTCASQNPYLNKSGEPCSFCGKLPDEIENCSDKPKTV